MRQENLGTYLVCFLAGTCFGATAALLAAPQSGRRTRRMVRDKVEDATEAASGTGHELRAHGRRVAKDAAGVVDRAVHAMSVVKG